jgi:Domain of unknown function (DUF4157)
MSQTFAPPEKKSITRTARPLIQRSASCGACVHAAGPREEDEILRRKESGGAKSMSGAPPIVHAVLRSVGQPLDAAARSFFEPRFGADFSAVRVHTDAKAAESARRVNALAYTVGRDVVFGAGQYAPNAGEGRRLLAHELTHTLQQTQAATGQITSGELRIGAVNDAFEQEADANSIRSIMGVGMQNRQRQPGGARLQRQVDTSGGTGSPTVYMCSKSLETLPIGRHAFFRIGGSGPGNHTFSLEPVNQPLFDPDDWDQEHGWQSGCWQGVPMRDFSEDFNANADCEATAISLSCLESEFAAYPIGMYCSLGPNSNTFVGTLARNCGLSNPDPAGWTPGIDDDPPDPGTFAPSPKSTLLIGCAEKLCGRGM